MSLDNIQQLMTEIGPLTDQALAVVQDGEDHWEIFLEDERAVGIDYAEDTNQLTFSIDIGSPSGDLLKVYQTLLGYNALWRETNGLRAALYGENHDVVLLFDLFAQDLDVSQLATVIARLLEKQVQWQEAIEQIGSGTVEPDSHPLFDQTNSIQV